MKNVQITDGPSISDLEAALNFDDSSRSFDFKTLQGWQVIFIHSIEMNTKRRPDVTIEGDNFNILYDTVSKTGTLTSI